MEIQQREENLQRQLQEMHLREENSQRQMREMQQRQQNSQRRLTETQRQHENLQRQLQEMTQREENSQKQLRVMQQREGNLQTRLRETQRQQENVQRQLQEVTQREENSQRQLREMQQRLENSQQQVSTLERQLRGKDQEVNELELSLSLAQQTISEQQQQQSCDWVISRDEIQITNKCLGRGGWASVYEGVYCGCTVAVKQIHDLILSPHNILLFEREMNIASKCRHPHLLQFIGATNDEGNPLFVTELMEKSLRALLEQRQLAEVEIRVISLDVARAINYLHQKKPEPIIHRDISSANVLLWRQGDQWRGKVSDYGTANFMQQTMTVASGAMIYSAPEALTSNQTVKVDVYSFGVLLCEMCIRQLPDPRRREQQVLLMTNRALRGLVRRCLQTDPEARATMQEIIDEPSRAV
ncbi:probable serine/threonine-protein kinase drkD [Porites lutea]|uniref:probable serine/threonine-protein kinase drkD n=1 Tax=Porites lutea TaxID=51062 RepID=UPI003CC65CD7